MPRRTLLVLLIASGLAWPGVAAAGQFKLFQEKAQAPEHNAQTHLLCSFKTGPLAGQVRALPESTALKLGEPCTDGAGSTGDVIVRTVPSDAGVWDSMGKIKHQYPNENYDYQPRLPPATAEPPPPPPPATQVPSTTEHGTAGPAIPRPVPPATIHLPSGSGHGAGAATAAEPPAAARGDTRPDRSPASAEPPVIAPSTASSATATTAAVTPDEVQQVHLWYEGLDKGSAVYRVPKEMVMGQTYSATAVIHPPTSPAPAAPDAHALKISPYMRIVLNQTGNPGTFEIKPQGNDCKFVSMDADTTWIFDVKPLLPGKDRVLDFSAYVVYGTGDATCKPENLKTIDVLSDTERVTIAAITPRKAWQDVVVSFITDPAKWFKFILPGGLGFAALKWLYGWWKKRKSARLGGAQPHTP